eukprot:1303607-Prymnesium_polylepis.1
MPAIDSEERVAARHEDDVRCIDGVDDDLLLRRRHARHIERVHAYAEIRERGRLFLPELDQVVGRSAEAAAVRG